MPVAAHGFHMQRFLIERNTGPVVAPCPYGEVFSHLPIQVVDDMCQPIFLCPVVFVMMTEYGPFWQVVVIINDESKIVARIVAPVGYLFVLWELRVRSVDKYLHTTEFLHPSQGLIIVRY